MTFMTIISKFVFSSFRDVSLTNQRWVIWLIAFFWNSYIQSSWSNSQINAWMRDNESSSSRLNYVLRLYMSRDLIMRLITTKSVFFASMRSVKRILKDVVCTISCFETSFLIWDVKIIFLRTKCASAMMSLWLCWEITIFRVQKLMFSFSRLIVKLKKHSMSLLSAWRRISSVCLSDFSSRSHRS
jgi:hypothetical protein